MNQLVLGAMGPYLVALVLYVTRRCRASLRMLVVTPVVMGLSALWAVVPDLPRVLGCYALYHRLARDPRTDIFYGHYTIDKIEGGNVPFHGILLLMILTLVLAAWRELQHREYAP